MTYRHKKLTDAFHLPIRFTRNYEKGAYEYFIGDNKFFSIVSRKSKDWCDHVAGEYLRQIRDYNLEDTEIYQSLVDAQKEYTNGVLDL
jgi:hypothetical protein